MKNKSKKVKRVTNMLLKKPIKILFCLPPNIKSMFIPRDSGYKRIDLRFDVPTTDFTIFLTKPKKKK